MDKPPFDPSQPFDAADKPPFDPNKPFEASPSVGRAEDAAKSVGAGLGSATIGTLGMVGDARSLLSKGVDALGSKLGFDPSTIKTAAGYAFPLANVMPTSQQIRSTVTDPIVDPDYKPQYETGKIAKKIAEFAPNVAFGGGVGGAIRNVIAPAVGSWAGGELGGPLGEFAGALAGGASATSAARKFQEMAAARQTAKIMPSADDLLKSGSNGFEAVKASDAIIKPSSVEQMAKDIKTEMLNAGKHPASDGQAGVFAALDRLEAMGASPGGVTPKDMEVIRKNLVDMKTNLAAGPTARMATDKFMEKYSNLGAGDLLNGTNPFPTLKDAIGDWAAGKRSETIQGKRNLAELNANTPVGMLDSGAGGQALQRTMKQLARPVNNTNMPVARRLGFNNQEVAAINEAASGTKLTHAAELMDRLIPAKLGAIPAMVARQIGGLTTKRQVSALDSLVRSRSPMASQVAAQFPPTIISQLNPKTQALLTALIAADPVLSKQASQPASQTVSQPNAYQAR
jgi:hypothetical protein